MESIKNVLNSCIDTVFYDYKNIGFVEELNQLRKCIINEFYETIPISRLIISLSVIDDIFLKIHDNDIGNIYDNIHD